MEFQLLSASHDRVRPPLVTTDEVETAISDSLREIGIERIKDKQKEAIIAFVS